MASSRRTSPTHLNKQMEWSHPPLEEDPRGLALQTNDATSNKYEVGRRREISDITRKHLEQVISAMIPSSTASSVDPVESTPVNSLATQQGYREPEDMSFKYTPKENKKPTIIYNYYISDKESGWKQLQKGEIPPNMPGNDTQKTFSKILTNRTQNETQMDQKLNVNQGIGTGLRTTITEVKQYHSEEGAAQNMSPPPTVNLNCPPPTRYEGSSETSTMLDCIHQLQLTLQQHVMTNSKQAEYHMSQNADLFMEMIQVQKRRDLDPAVMAIPTFTDQTFSVCGHLRRNIILGTDFAKENQAGVSWTSQGTRVLSVRGVTRLEVEEDELGIPVTTKYHVKIPPRYSAVFEVNLHGSCEGTKIISANKQLMETNPNAFQHEISVKPDGNKYYPVVAITNLDHAKMLHLAKGEIVGFAHDEEVEMHYIDTTDILEMEEVDQKAPRNWIPERSWRKITVRSCHKTMKFQKQLTADHNRVRSRQI